MTFIDYLPDNKKVDLNLYLLDPLSTIIKLAILSNKPIGTKISINKNVIYFQEPGPFQAFCRYVFNSNKTDIQYIYNPMELACQYYLSEDTIKHHAKIPELFKFAQRGLIKLMETYKNSSVMRLCLNYYYSLISNHLEKKNDTNLFRKDNLTACYTNELLQKWRAIWTQEKLKIVLNMISYLSKNDNSESEVKSLETIMENVDKMVQQIY